MKSSNRETEQAMPPLPELRERVQGPVRASNDIGGVLWGDWLSPPITMAFVKLGISPTVATIGMLVAGIAGSLLIPLDGGYAVAGSALVILFYVLDCVDGEVARYHGGEKFYWSYADFFFGVWSMSLFYIAIGVQAALQTGVAWLGLLGVGCVVFFTTKKFIDVAHVFLTVQHVVLPRGRMAMKFRAELEGSERNPLADSAPAASDRDGQPLSRRDVVARYGGRLGILRGALLNFHLSAVVYFLAAIADLFAPTFAILGLEMNLKTLFLFPCFLLVALNAIDYFMNDMRGNFMRKSRKLLGNL